MLLVDLPDIAIGLILIAPPCFANETEFLDRECASGDLIFLLKSADGAVGGDALPYHTVDKRRAAFL